VFSFGGQEILIVVVLALLLFGPDKIPQLAKTIGKFTKEFNKYKDIMESTIRMEISNADPQKDELTVEQRIAKAGAASQSIIDSSAASGGTAGPAAPAASQDPHVFAVPAADESDEEDEE
jgi:sec-independent protein translocase protein TatA